MEPAEGLGVTKPDWDVAAVEEHQVGHALQRLLVAAALHEPQNLFLLARDPSWAVRTVRQPTALIR